MLDINTKSLFLLLLAAVAALPAMADEGPDPTYDVSYVWSRDVAAVRDYREKVLRILGAGMAGRLRVVADDGLHGVVYLRRGDGAGALRVARAHSRVLEEKGLDPAAPIVSRDWVFVDPEQPMAESSPAVAASPETRPVSAAEPAVGGSTARDTHDLEAAVDAYIKQLRRDGRIGRDERTGWSVYDFTTGEKLVTINEDVQFQAASLIKPFVATAFFHRVQQGGLHYGSRSRRHRELMIQQSNNQSTNWVMRQVGGPAAVQRILKSNYPGIFRSTHIVEYIPAGGKTYRNKASAHDYSRFLYALWNERLPGAREIRRLMSLPGPDRIFTGVEEIPPGTRVLNKTGSTARLCADMGILSVQGPDGRRYPYTLIGIIEKENKAGNYTTWIRSRSEVIRDVSDIVYRGIARRHEFGELM
jgi:beta-lactamase class A